MPIARFQMPDGRVARFEVPDGTTPEAAESMMEQHFASRPEAPAEPKPDPTGSFVENLAAGAGKGMYDLARGVGQRGREAMEGMGLKGAADAVGLPTQRDIDEAKKRDAPLEDTAGGAIGHVVGSVAAAAPIAFIPGVNTVPGAMIAGGAMGAAQPTSGNESALVNTVVGAGMGAAGQYGAGKVGDFLARRAAARTAQMGEESAQQATRDAALQAGRQAGYVVPPSAINPNLGTQSLEAIGGKIPMAHAASFRNQAVTDRLSRQAIGLSPTAPLNGAMLDSIRSQAGRAYNNIRQLSQKFTLDAQYQQEVSAIGQEFAAAAREFPSIASMREINALKTDLGIGNAYGRSFQMKQEISPAAAIEAVKKLRFDASHNFKAIEDPAKAELARAQRAAADALDGLLERNLDAIGRRDLATQYRQARVQIAKTFDVQAALKADGHIDAQILARIGQQQPLSGELGLIAKFAGSFPKATQPVAPIGAPGIGSNFRTGISAAAAAGGWMSGGPVGAAIGAAAPFAVPGAIRAAMLSRPGQRMLATPNYSTAGARRLAQALNSPISQRAIPTIAQELEQQ